MLLNKSDASTYVMDFKKRFENFCSKAPLLMSYTTTPTLVQVVDESTDTVYEVPFDFSIPVKSFIYGIKQLLIRNGCYPIIDKVESYMESIPKEEQISLASNGTPIDQIPVSRMVETVRSYRIDKTIIYRDIFIIQDLATGEMFRYHLKKSSVFFLKKMRNKEKTSRESGEYFFQHAELMNQLDPKEE